MFLRKIIVLVLLTSLLSIAGFGEEYPKTVTVKCGKIKIQLSKHTYWNINKLWYEKHYIGESSGYWGTVFAIPRLGLIGSGHLTKKGLGEDVKSLKIFADGKYISPEQAAQSVIECKEFCLKKNAKVKDITFDYTLTVKNNKLNESCKLQTTQDQRLALMYNFMHPWSRKLTDYYVKVSADKTELGLFTTDNKFRYTGPMEWISLYDTAKNIGIVSKASGDPRIIRLWDRKGYKKIYLQSLKKDTMKTGKVYSYSMETDFYRASPDTWKAKAKSIAENTVMNTSDNNTKPKVSVSEVKKKVIQKL